MSIPQICQEVRAWTRLLPIRKPTPFTANVIAVNYKAGAAVVDLIVAVPFGIDNAARNGNANFSLHTTLQYISTDNTVEILDSGPVSIRDKTVVLYHIDNRTVAIQLTLSFGNMPVPSGSPSYTATAEITAP